MKTLIAYKPEGKAKESSFSSIASLREAKVNDANRTVETCIIQEGLGNFGDMHFYTKEALQSAPAIFDGEKIYADHPTKSEETDRPERTIRDNLGYHTDVRYEENPSGRGQIFSVVKVLAGAGTDWAWQQMKEAVAYAMRYPNKSLVGVSINANGQSTEVPIDDFLESYPFPADPDVKAKVEQAKAMGKKSVYAVSKMTEAVSADMVTQAGAGGKFTKIKESNKGGKGMKVSAWIKGLMEKVKSGKTEDVEEELKARLKEEELKEKKQADPPPDDDSKEAEEDDETDEAEEAEEAEEADEAYQKYKAGGGKMTKQAFMKKQSKKQADEADEKKEKKESTSVIRLKAENALLTERMRKLELSQVIKDVLLEAGFAESIERKIRPLLEAAKDEDEVREIVKEWSDAMKEAAVEKVGTGPGKGSSLRESSNDDCFSGLHK